MVLHTNIVEPFKYLNSFNVYTKYNASYETESYLYDNLNKSYIVILDKHII